jgi:hypothetical protein
LERRLGWRKIARGGCKLPPERHLRIRPNNGVREPGNLVVVIGNFLHEHRIGTVLLR